MTTSLAATVAVAAWQWLSRPLPPLDVLVLPPEIAAGEDEVAAQVAVINLQSSIV